MSAGEGPEGSASDSGDPGHDPPTRDRARQQRPEHWPPPGWPAPAPKPAPGGQRRPSDSYVPPGAGRAASDEQPGRQAPWTGAGPATDAPPSGLQPPSGSQEPPGWQQGPPGQQPPPGWGAYGWQPPSGPRRPGRWWHSTPNLITAVAVAAIAVAVLVEAVRRGYLSTYWLIYFLVAIPSIMFHEVSHGIVALWCGDDTAKRAGRISANPIRHIDPLGTIILPVILALAHGPILGWAKPVPVNISRLRHPRNQAVLVGLAGPFSNYLLAAVAGGFMHLVYVSHQTDILNGVGAWHWVFEVLFLLGLVNVLLGTFNLIPIPPLDGASLVERLLPASALPGYYRMRMGFMLLVFAFVFFAPGALESVYNHVATWYLNLFLPT